MSISVVIPVYNSEKILNDLASEICINLVSYDFEIIFINDNSQDNSWEKIKRISSSNNKVKGINLLHNYGQHNSIMAGLFYARYNYIITMDDDLQHSPNYIPQMVNEIKNGHDICYTNYKKRKHRIDKVIFSNFSNFISSFLLNKPLKLYLSSYRCFNKEIRDKLIRIENPNIYIDGYLINFSKKITSIDIIHQKRHSGKTNYSFKKLFILWIKLVNQSKIFPFRIFSILILFIKLLLYPYNLYLNLMSKNKLQYKILNKTF